MTRSTNDGRILSEECCRFIFPKELRPVAKLKRDSSNSPYAGVQTLVWESPNKFGTPPEKLRNVSV
ncbi:MAG: hypothetical protein BroJett011_54260 [Chloroflexota bacterium]|nr:MAG: hypothetical protein BroJett011_54260 [Chloroflexota bacterium]